MWSILRSDQDILYQCAIPSALKRSRKILCGNYDLNNLYYKLLSFRTFSAISLFNTVFLIEQYRRVCEPHCSRCVKQNIFLLPPHWREKKFQKEKKRRKKNECNHPKTKNNAVCVFSSDDRASRIRGILLEK